MLRRWQRKVAEKQTLIEKNGEKGSLDQAGENFLLPVRTVLPSLEYENFALTSPAVQNNLI